MKARFLSGFGTTSTAQVSAAVRARSFSTTQRATSRPMPGLARVEAVVVLHPERPPAGVEEDGVARLDVALLHVLALERGADVGDHDLLAGVHHPALHRLDVDEMPAGEKRLQLLDSELLQAIGVADFRSREAVVEAHLGTCRRPCRAGCRYGRGRRTGSRPDRSRWPGTRHGRRACSSRRGRRSDRPEYAARRRGRRTAACPAHRCGRSCRPCRRGSISPRRAPLRA